MSGEARAIPVRLVETRGPCGCSIHTDLDGYDRARDEAQDADMDRMERESREDERRAERDARW